MVPVLLLVLHCDQRQDVERRCVPGTADAVEKPSLASDIERSINVASTSTIGAAMPSINTAAIDAATGAATRRWRMHTDTDVSALARAESAAIAVRFCQTDKPDTAMTKCHHSKPTLYTSRPIGSCVLCSSPRLQDPRRLLDELLLERVE